MSTNYYAFGPGITDSEGLHIGQSAAGWRFLFRAWPERGLTTFAAWLEFILQPGVAIRNEYGREVPAEEMVATMAALADQRGRPLQPRYRNGPRHAGESIDAEGNAFYHGEFC